VELFDFNFYAKVIPLKGMGMKAKNKGGRTQSQL
jgi:hypothetical protein